MDVKGILSSDLAREWECRAQIAYQALHVCGAREPPAALFSAADLSSPATFTVWPFDSCLKSSSLIVSRSAGQPPALAVLTCGGKECSSHEIKRPPCQPFKLLDTTCQVSMQCVNLERPPPKGKNWGRVIKCDLTWISSFLSWSLLTPTMLSCDAAVGRRKGWCSSSCTADTA